MNIKYKDLLPGRVLNNIGLFRGYVLIWRGHLGSVPNKTHTQMLLNRINKLKATDINSLVECYDLYENADKTQELVYIHNISSIKNIELSEVLDLSGVVIPETYNILETSKENIPNFPYTPRVPRLKHMKYSSKKEYSTKDQKKIVAIALFSAAYHKHPSLNAIIELMKKDNFINSVDEVIEWAFRGMRYIGFKRYTAKEAMSEIYNKLHIKLNGRFKSINNDIINYELYGSFFSHSPEVIDYSDDIYYYNMANDHSLNNISEYIESVYE